MTSVCTVTMTSACRVPQTAVQRAAGAWSLWPGRSSSAWRPTGASVRRRPGKAQEDGDGPRRAGPATQGTQACPGVATRGLPSPSRARGPDRCARGRGLETAESAWVPVAQAGASGGGRVRRGPRPALRRQRWPRPRRAACLDVAWLVGGSLSLGADGTSSSRAPALPGRVGTGERR